eukprot:10462393-Alexandrium_andersonii.AAC.1
MISAISAARAAIAVVDVGINTCDAWTTFWTNVLCLDTTGTSKDAFAEMVLESAPEYSAHPGLWQSCSRATTPRTLL